MTILKVSAEVQAVLYKGTVDASDEYHEMLIKEVIRRLGMLSNDDRFIIEIRFYDDLTHEEIATILNTSRKNVGFRIKKILKKMKRFE